MPGLTVLSAGLVTVLAQQPGDGDGGGQGEDFGKSSPLGLFVMILLLIAVILLIRSMTKHLKRVPASFDGEPEAGRTGTGEGGTAATEAAATEVESPGTRRDRTEHD